MGASSKAKFYTFFLGILFATVYSAAASGISFQIIQHDSTQDKIRTASYVIENTLFDYFYEGGFIVTNSPTVISSGPGEDKSLYYKSLDEAKDGSCDYFIAIMTDYDVSASVNPSAVLLSNITAFSWEIFDVRSGNKIASGSKSTGAVDAKKNNKDGVASFTRQVAKKITSSIIAK